MGFLAAVCSSLSSSCSEKDDAKKSARALGLLGEVIFPWVAEEAAMTGQAPASAATAGG